MSFAGEALGFISEPPAHSTVWGNVSAGIWLSLGIDPLLS